MRNDVFFCAIVSCMMYLLLKIINFKTSSLLIPVQAKLPVQPELHFFVQTRGSDQDCGGCVVLQELVHEMKRLNLSVSSGYANCPEFQAGVMMTIIYPEVAKRRCNYPGALHVHWMLALLGKNVNKKVVRRWWRPDDLVFHYGDAGSKTTTAFPIPTTNQLAVARNPCPGDDTDPNLVHVEPDNQREGLAWMMRKGQKFHPDLTSKLPHDNCTLASGSVREVVRNNVLKSNEIISKSRYFLSYDPYSFWSMKAAMLGAVSIVYPLSTHSREEWVASFYLSAALAAKGLDMRLPGVAYGWSQDELDYANATRHLLRPLLMECNAWLRSVTIPRFTEDCARWHNGEKDRFRGGVLARDFYPNLL